MVGVLIATSECQPMSQNSHSFGFDQLQTPQFSVNHQPPQPMSMEALQAQEDLMKSIESFLKKFNRISFGKTPKQRGYRYINTPAWNRPLVYCDDDDDEDYTIAITPESPTKEPVNSLSLGDEHLDTIPATESDEFIKSSVENLFTFPTPLFDIDEDFTLSDESFSEEDIPKENFIIFSNPLFDLDEEIASTKVDRINNEVLEGILSIPPGIDSFDAESDLFAVTSSFPNPIPPEIEEVEFDPEGDIIPFADNDSLMEEIELVSWLGREQIPPGIESDDVQTPR
ncbi:hypothetical protein Tco_0014162 [Tanacetum coccineum]